MEGGKGGRVIFQTSVRHAEMHQLLHCALQIGGIRKHIELCLVIDTIPDDNILASRRHRASNREEQTPIEGDLEKAQHLATQRAVRQVANARKTYSKEGSTWMRMFGGLQARGNAEIERESECVR